MAAMRLHKDEILDRLAELGNVAQFVALRPDGDGLAQTYNRIRGHEPNETFASIEAALQAVLTASEDRMVNVRSYAPDDLRSREFVYGLTTVADVMATVDRLSGEGLHLIVNETIDISDGGVSGVVQGGVIEFAPDDTPRCVEKSGVTALPQEQAISMLETIYGFRPDLEVTTDERVEFSIHPRPRGWRGGHTILWEHETGVALQAHPSLTWPNHFSRMLGDKVFGLLVADALGAAVPRTLSISRRVAPYSFGRPTGSAERWTRTCPVEPLPGLYTTTRGWEDPFTLMANEDPSDTSIASVLCQDAVHPEWSGAALVQADGTLLVEGRRGQGDLFMLGQEGAAPLPKAVIDDVHATHTTLSATLGPTRLEWVHDGNQLWIVQLHLGATQTSDTVIVPGDAEHWLDFTVTGNLEELRQMLDSIGPDRGVRLAGDFGLTSHVADLVRRAGVPARRTEGGSTPLIQRAGVVSELIDA